MTTTGARVLGAVGLALALGCAGARASGKMVDVGGFRLRIHCTGKGWPTVVLEAGAGDSHLVWRAVQRSVGRFSKTCSYDRAGLGRSQPGPLPRTSRRMAGELWTLLEQAAIDGPLVLVGHSLGGMNVRLFASAHPNRVVGLVLVEATHEDYPAAEAELLSTEERIRIETNFALLGAAARSEYESIATSAAELRASPWPDVPTWVVTAGRRGDPPERGRLWRELQDRLAAGPSVVRHIVAEHSGHAVHLDQPELVVEAIREAVDMAHEAQGTDTRAR